MIFSKKKENKPTPQEELAEAQKRGTGPAIGIDLGTAASTVAGNIVTIAATSGTSTTNSYTIPINTGGTINIPSGTYQWTTQPWTTQPVVSGSGGFAGFNFQQNIPGTNLQAEMLYVYRVKKEMKDIAFFDLIIRKKMKDEGTLIEVD